jgi:tetratricopeptide (TPR) repeat protein
MPSTLRRILVPCSVVLFSTFVAFGVFLTRPAHTGFDDSLRLIPVSPSPIAAIEKAKKALAFRIKHLSVQTQPTATLIADAYFRLGEAIFERNEPALFPQGIECYQEAVDWDPAVRHGWAFFQLGRLHELLHEWETAFQHFQQVKNYDHGRLSLRAGYRQSIMQARMGQTVESAPVYHYLRFYATDIQKALAPFENAHFDHEENTQLLLLLQQHFQQPHLEPSALLTFLETQPEDRFYNFVKKTCFPDAADTQAAGSWDLFSSFHAPHAAHNGGLILYNDGVFIADVYLPPSYSGTLVVEVTVENIAASTKTILCTLLPTHSKQETLGKTKKTVRFLFPSHQWNAETIKHTIEIYFTDQEDTSPRPATSFLKLLAIHAWLASPGTEP